MDEEKNINPEQQDIHEDDFYEEPSGGYGETYELPEEKTGFIDTVTGEVKGKEDLTPWDMIKSIAVQTNTKINNPKGSCKFCYGRGYEGIDSATKSPIPCRCIYPPKSDIEKFQEAFYDSGRIGGRINRKQRRKIQSNMKKLLKQQAKILKKRKERGYYNSPKGLSADTSATGDVNV